MKLVYFVFLTVIIFHFICACQQTGKATLDYGKLTFDTTRIAIFEWDTTKHSPNNSDPLPLTQDDIRVTDSLLNDAIDSFNINVSPGLYDAFDHLAPLDSFVIKPKNYRYQFFPYKDVNGQAIIAIIGFSGDYDKWKTEVYFGRHHYGIHKITLKINLSEKKRENLTTCSYG